MQASTFDVIERRKRITIFKLGKLWVFKQFFDNHAAGLLQQRPLSFRVQVHRREEQCPQAPGAQRLRLRPGGGPEGIHGPAPQISEICAGPEELRGLQRDREREVIPDEGSGSGRGGGGLGRENS